MPINRNVINGVTIGGISVEKVVNDTDNAKSPLAINVITSDTVHPGTTPTKTSPIVNAIS